MFLDLPDVLIEHIMSFVNDQHIKYIIYVYLPENLRQNIQRNKKFSNLYPMTCNYLSFKYINYLSSFFPNITNLICEIDSYTSFNDSFVFKSSYINDLELFKWGVTKNIINTSHNCAVENFIKSKSIDSLKYAFRVGFKLPPFSFSTACNIGDLSLIKWLVEEYREIKIFEFKSGMKEAIKRGHMDIMNYLYDRVGYHCFDNSDNNNGHLAFYAIKHNKLFVDWLWKRGYRWTYNSVINANKLWEFSYINEDKINRLLLYKN